MKRILWALAFSTFLPLVAGAAHAQKSKAAATGPATFQVGVDLLSRTDGAEAGPYLRVLISDLKRQWMPLARAAAGPSPTEQEETVLALTIAPDGHFLSMRIEGSAGDRGLDEAAWTAAKGTKPLALPSGMKDPNLMLRVHFMVGQSF